MPVIKNNPKSIKFTVLTMPVIKKMKNCSFSIVFLMFLNGDYKMYTNSLKITSFRTSLETEKIVF